MIRSFKAELLKMRRRRVAIVMVLSALAFAAVASLSVLLSATDSLASGQPGASIASLSSAGGATEAFSIGVSFAGILIFVLFIANFAGEFSQGTFRTMLMRQPKRIGLLAGKAAALLVFAAGILILAELFTAVLSTVIAPSQDIATSSWFTLDGLGEAMIDFGRALFGVAAWGSLGIALAVLVRSVPIALGIGIVWAGPLEHLMQDGWDQANQWFPGLLLESLASAGSEVSTTRVLVLVTIYATVAAALAAIVFRRRDITA